MKKSKIVVSKEDYKSLSSSDICLLLRKNKNYWIVSDDDFSDRYIIENINH